ncbi:HD domain-containing phosphohydrolase [Clostridium sp. DJ247]|uniref:HD domain-containing phosphohydrolase n=1 Tax=Clostridium sp. DJ247 TaxID=2726188 RepID=UPI0016296E3E|nr:HD domain-containing phosphohydrolase [Clostridium sp. DJ247]MBC2580875.1 HD domain-containing protein [Clostridium sp. DJ247]
MATNKNKSLATIYKKNLIISITLVSLTAVIVWLITIANLSNTYTEVQLINVLDKQRMLTQIMAKDANRIYELHSSIENYKNIKENKSDLEKKLSATITDLQQARKEYENQYNTIKNGYIQLNNKNLSFKNALEELQPVISKKDKIWKKFNSSIDTIIKEPNNTLELFNAVKYINENNEPLLQYSNNITDIVLSNDRKRTQSIFYIIIFLAVLMLVSLLVFVITILKNLFIPINQMNKCMEQVGISMLDDVVPTSKEQKVIPMFQEVRTIFNEFNSLILLIENLNKNIPFKHILNYIFESFIEYIPYTYIGIALMDNDEKIINASYAISGKHHKNLPKRILGLKVSIKETSLGKIIESGNERIINDLEEHVAKAGKPIKEYNKILLEEGIRSSITFPLKRDNKAVGIIFFSSNVKNVYNRAHIRFLRTLANSIMLSIEKDIFIQDMIISSTLALATLTEERDPETGDHLNRMKAYSKKIAELLSHEEKYKEIIDIEYINNIERFSPLHDIGKVAIKDDILLKPGKLTDEEYEIMKTHAIYGARVLAMAEENVKKRGLSIFKMGIEIAGGHHEKWDGSGYPYGKKGEEIPLSARIVAIADVFDALTSKRPYKKAFTFEDTVEIIIKDSGKHFDPYIVSVFMENISVIRSLYNRFNHISKS